jgi:hypothetical protein
MKNWIDLAYTLLWALIMANHRMWCPCLSIHNAALPRWINWVLYLVWVQNAKCHCYLYLELGSWWKDMVWKLCSMKQMLVNVFQPLHPQLQQKTNHQTTKSCSTKQCLCTKLSVESWLLFQVAFNTNFQSRDCPHCNQQQPLQLHNVIYKTLVLRQGPLLG